MLEADIDTLLCMVYPLPPENLSTLNSFLPMTPRLVRRRYSKGLVLLTVCKKGYRNRGMCAARNADLEMGENGPVRITQIETNKRDYVLGFATGISRYLVSGCEATHWRSAKALHTLLDW